MISSQPLKASTDSREDFLRKIEKALEIPKGTLRGDEALEDTGEWNSLAVVQFISLADEQYGVTPDVDRIAACLTFNDLYALVRSDTH